jgi:hypothetical protein
LDRRLRISLWRGRGRGRGNPGKGSGPAPHAGRRGSSAGRSDAAQGAAERGAAAQSGAGAGGAAEGTGPGAAAYGLWAQLRAADPCPAPGKPERAARAGARPEALAQEPAPGAAHVYACGKRTRLRQMCGSLEEDGRGDPGAAGLGPCPGSGHSAHPREMGLREPDLSADGGHRPAPGPGDRKGSAGGRTAGLYPDQQVRGPLAAVPPAGDPAAAGGGHFALDHVRLGPAGGGGSGTAAASHGAGPAPEQSGADRRHPGAGAGPGTRQNQGGPAVGASGGRGASARGVPVQPDAPESVRPGASARLPREGPGRRVCRVRLALPRRDRHGAGGGLLGPCAQVLFQGPGHGSDASPGSAGLDRAGSCTRSRTRPGPRGSPAANPEESFGRRKPHP